MIITLSEPDDFSGWREGARRACTLGLAPTEVSWRMEGENGGLFDAPSDDDTRPERSCDAAKPRSMRPTPPRQDCRKVVCPKVFLGMAERALCHRDPERFDKLYRLLWRLQNERSLLSNLADGDVHWLMAREKEVRRDIHKTHAFVRFRKVDESDRGRERFAAWFEPSQFSLRLSAPFFARRFPNMDWMIATPEGCAIWKDEKLIFGPGGSARSVPDADGVEAEWRAYFAAIFNPARLKISAMCAEMPKKFWRNLPEADLIATLVADARLRVDAMTDGAVTTPNRLAECLQRQRGKGAL